ncbi:cytochrome P450 [Xylariomycetidae sp. FL2044]|nr:cytochrome P450 [Xylariomycetidae sp. FL2044]
MLDQETLSRPAVLAPALLVIAYVLYQLLRPSDLPDLPTVGARPGEWFSHVRAKWRNTMDMRAATETAYYQYRDRAVNFPIAGGGDLVMLPLRELQWLVDQPDADISMHDQVTENLQLHHTVKPSRLALEPAHVPIVAGRLTRETGNLVPALLDEVRVSVDGLWGTDARAWTEVCVYDVMRRVIGQATNRVFVGLPLCRDPRLLDAGMAYAQDVPLSSTALKFIWAPLRPLAALLLTLPNRIHTRRFFNIIRPEVLKRLRDYEARRQRQATDPEKEEEEEPNDFLQWSVHQAKASADPWMSEPDTLAGRILLLNFASIHTSSFTITHVLLDLACGRQAYVDELRREIEGALAAHGGQWNKRALAAMPKLDSTFRESQRLNSFVTMATNRVVTNPKGVTTPSGVHLPYGVAVCTPSYPVFHDPDLYPEPEAFRPFRFAERRDALDRNDDDGDSSSNKNTTTTTNGSSSSSYVQKARQAFPTTSPEYTAFGHGRHACPGRFFASSELKLMLAYILLHYDFQIQPDRPANPWFGMNRIPPMKATIKVRRREGKETEGKEG